MGIVAGGRGKGWVPASAGAREGDGFPPSSSRGAGASWEQRRRGHGDGSPHPRGHGRGVPALVFTGGRLCAGTTEAGRDGSPHARGQREGEGGSRTRPYVGANRQVVDGQPQGACFRNRVVFDGRDVGLATRVEVGATRLEAGRWLGPR